jgi:hypothetical protein
MKKFVIEIDEKYKCPIYYETRDGEDLCYIESDPCVGRLSEKPAWCPLVEVDCTDIAGKQYHVSHNGWNK